MLSPSSLDTSSISSAFVETDLASTSVALCFSSGYILFMLLLWAVEPRLLERVFSFDIFAVKNWAY
jgi:hypothetical protein